MSRQMLSLALAAVLFPFALTATAAPLETVLEQASADRLYAHPYWRLLLRYENGPADRPASPVRTPGFFLHPDGRTDAEAELRAGIHALYTDFDGLGDQAFACRFPARAAWLREQLPITDAELSPVACAALDTWMSGINPQQATLIFASDYLNNPSSMFGHTLLRIDAPDQTEDTRLLAYAVNYTAQTEASNSLDFAWKGLTGGYPGAFSVLPYYQKVKEYNDFENRDLWEYPLNLSPAEVRRMLQHLWELREVRLPYFFLSSNCSYQLLGLFEAARPGLLLRRDFPVHAIPADTLRRVLAEDGMLKDVVYRPAAGTQLDAQARDNAAAVNQAAMRLADHPDTALTALEPPAQARALETGYDWLNYRYLAHRADPATAPAHLRRLLLRRSTLAEADGRRAPPRPAVDPSQGHRTLMVQPGLGQAQGEDFLALDYRPAYHDLLDPDGGYRQGAAIDFLRLQLRYHIQAEKLDLEQFTLVHIDSLAPRNDFLKPVSWRLGVGARQLAMNSDGRFTPDERHAVTYLDVAAGLTLQPSAGSLCFGLVQNTLEGGKSLDQGWRFGIGPLAGCRTQGRRGQWLAQADSLWFHDRRRFRHSADAGYQWQWDARQGIRLQARYQAEAGQHRQEVTLGWRRYY